jgi:hypothetical protein
LATSEFELPAETDTKMPPFTSALTALFNAVEKPPPMLILTTAPCGQPRVGASLATKLMPEMTPDVVPEPWSLSTLTPRTVAFLATP